MLYVDNHFTYNLEDCIWRHSEEWKKILFNVLTVKIALLANSEQRMKLKEVDLHGMMLDVVNDAVPIFDKFLTNVKSYRKVPCIDEYDGTDTELYQDVDYKVMLHPFKGFFDSVEVR